MPTLRNYRLMLWARSCLVCCIHIPGLPRGTGWLLENCRVSFETRSGSVEEGQEAGFSLLNPSFISVRMWLCPILPAGGGSG